MLKSLLVVAMLGCGTKADVPSAGSAVVVAKPIDAAAIVADVAPADAGSPVPLSGEDMIKLLDPDGMLGQTGTFQVLYWKPGNLQLVFLLNDSKETSEGVKTAAVNLVTMEVEILIKAGYNPRVEQANVSLDMLILGKSVTGAQTHVDLGHALYFWPNDKVTWEATVTTTTTK